MKKAIFMICLVCLLSLLGGCKQNDSLNQSPQITGTDLLTVTPTITPTITTKVSEPTAIPTPDNLTEKGLFTIEDYFPMSPDAEYIYEGEGNEYASFRTYTDFTDISNKRVQTRTINGGTEIVEVIQNSGGELSVILSKEECYYRDKFLEKGKNDSKAEILLKEPLVEGTEWILPNNRKRYISNTEAEVETPLGNFKALEITTEGNDGVTKEYYAENLGKIKQIFLYGESEITSTLKEIRLEVPYTQLVDFYYVSINEQIYVKQKKLSFYTNDTTQSIIQEVAKEEVEEDYLPVIGLNTEINFLYLGSDSTVYVDFSKEFIEDMNAGAAYEALIIQSITNTLGNYYGVEDVYITVDENPYESGHMLLKEGKTFKVNMSQVVRP